MDLGPRAALAKSNKKQEEYEGLIAPFQGPLGYQSFLHLFLNSKLKLHQPNHVGEEEAAREGEMGCRGAA